MDVVQLAAVLCLAWGGMGAFGAFLDTLGTGVWGRDPMAAAAYVFVLGPLLGPVVWVLSWGR